MVYSNIWLCNVSIKKNVWPQNDRGLNYCCHAIYTSTLSFFIILYFYPYQVDLADLAKVKTMADANYIVTRSATNIMDKANQGLIQAAGLLLTIFKGT